MYFSLNSARIFFRADKTADEEKEEKESKENSEGEKPPQLIIKLKTINCVMSRHMGLSKYNLPGVKCVMSRHMGLPIQRS